VLKSRFELFAATSIAIHAAVFAGVLMKRSHPVPPDAGAAGGTPGAGAATVAGDTFEVPDLEETTDESAAGSEGAPIELDGPTVAPPDPNGETAIPRPTRRSHGGPAHAHAPEAAPTEPPPPLYGAVGDRAAGDLVTSFKRMFPVGASYDPLWEKVPVGFYAEGDVTFYLAEDGSLTHTTVSASAAPAFRMAILQTTMLLKHRLFTAKGAATHLHMVVRVTDHLVNHGAFSIDAAGSFELRSGKHVSVSAVER
jgi:hypothetical protein